MTVRFSDVSMYNSRIITAASQSTAQSICDHDGTVTAAGATYAYRHIRFSFALVLRQQVVKQVAETVQSLLDLGLRFQVVHHPLVVT